MYILAFLYGQNFKFCRAFEVKEIAIELHVPHHTSEWTNGAFSHICSASLKGFPTTITTISLPASQLLLDVMLTICFPNVIFLM